MPLRYHSPEWQCWMLLRIWNNVNSQRRVHWWKAVWYLLKLKISYPMIDQDIGHFHHSRKFPGAFFQFLPKSLLWFLSPEISFAYYYSIRILFCSIYRVWLLLLNVFSRFIHVTLYISSMFFIAENIPQFVGPFFSWRTFGLFPIWA